MAEKQSWFALSRHDIVLCVFIVVFVCLVRYYKEDTPADRHAIQRKAEIQEQRLDDSGPRLRWPSRPAGPQPRRENAARTKGADAQERRDQANEAAVEQARQDVGETQ